METSIFFLLKTEKVIISFLSENRLSYEAQTETIKLDLQTLFYTSTYN